MTKEVGMSLIKKLTVNDEPWTNVAYACKRTHCCLSQHPSICINEDSAVLLISKSIFYMAPFMRRTCQMLWPSHQSHSVCQTHQTPYNCHTSYSCTHIQCYYSLRACGRTDVGSLSSCSGEPLKAVAHLLEVLILPLSLLLLCIALLLLLYCSFPLSSFFMCLSPSPFALLRTRPVPSPPPARSNTEGCPSELSDGAVICIHRALP